MSTGGLALLVTLAAMVLGFVLIAALRRMVQRQRQAIEVAAEQSLVDLFIFIDTRQLLAINLVLLVVLPLLAWLLSENLLLVAGAIMLATLFPRLLVRRQRKRRLERFVYQMPDALLMLASSLRAGMGLGSALEVLSKEQPAPFSQEMALLLRQQRLGMSFDDALAVLEKRLPVEEFRLLTAAMRISRSVGGNLADTLETLAQTLTRKAEVEGKIRSLTAQGRIQAIVMTGLPILLIVVLRVLQPQQMAYLFHTFIGWGVLGFVVLMEVAGFFFIRKIVQIEV